MPDMVKRAAQTTAEMQSARQYNRLLEIKTKKGYLTHNEQKQLARARTNLLRSGVIAPLQKAEVRAIASAAYSGFPWYKKLYLKAKFYLLVVMRGWLRARIAQFQIRRLAKTGAPK